MSVRLAVFGFLCMVFTSCESLKLGQKAPTDEVNPYELVDNGGYSPGGFYGDPEGASSRLTGAGYPAEGQTFGTYGGSSTSGSAAAFDHAEIAPFSEDVYGHSSPEPTRAAKPKPAVSSRPPVRKPAAATAKKSSPAPAVAAAAKKKAPVVTSAARRSESRTTAGTGQGSVVKALYHPPGYAASTKKKATIHRVHTVKPGDTLTKLAARYEVTIAEVKKQNQLTSDLIRVGQRLTID